MFSSCLSMKSKLSLTFWTQAIHWKNLVSIISLVAFIPAIVIVLNDAITASAMPQIAAEDVNACRQAPSRHTSPTEELLRIWGTKGYSVLQLYKVLAKVKHVRAMKVIRHLGMLL